MRTPRIALLVAVLVVCSPLRAHHDAYACLVRDRSVTVEGLIDDIRFEDPHVVLTIKTDLSIVVTAEWRTIWELSNRWGITREFLRRGDRVLVRGSPYDCEENRMSIIVEVRRLEDGWSWNVPAPIVTR